MGFVKILSVLTLILNIAAAQLGVTRSSLSAACVQFPSSYPPTESLYASQYCRLCTGLGLSPSIEACCAAANPTACFATSFYGKTLTASPTSAPITVAPASLSGPANCNAAISIFQTCNAATPGFSNLCFHEQQSCYCSTSGTAAPDRYDNYFSACLAWASVNEPSSYSVLGAAENGNVQSRKCQSYSQLIATGGKPSNCLTSASPTLSSASRANARPTAIAPTSSNAAPTTLPFGITGVLMTVVHFVYM